MMLMTAFITHIYTKLPVVNDVTKVSAIRKVFSPSFVDFSQALINHVPNETSLRSGIARIPEHIPIQMKITIRVVHRMTILTENDWSIFVFATSQTFCLMNVRIHGTYNISEFCLSHAFCPRATLPHVE